MPSWLQKYLYQVQRKVFFPTDVLELGKAFNDCKLNKKSLCEMFENCKELLEQIIAERGVLYFWAEDFKTEFANTKEPRKKSIQEKEEQRQY